MATQKDRETRSAATDKTALEIIKREAKLRAERTARLKALRLERDRQGKSDADLPSPIPKK